MNEQIISDALFAIAAGINRVAAALEKETRLTAAPPVLAAPPPAEPSDIELEETV
jgi:hypothetical protein